MKSENVALVVFLTTVLANSFFVKSSKASSATIFVNPSTNDVALGDNFTVDIDLDFAENLYCYEIWLSFNNTVLNATTIEYRDYLNEPHFIWYQQVNNTGGYVTLSVSSTYPAAPKTGGSPPPLATINFTATRVGMSQLHLYNTVLVDNQSMTIPHENSQYMRCNPRISTKHNSANICSSHIVCRYNSKEKST